MLRIFTPVKIQQLRLGLNLQTWVPEASMLTTRPPKPSKTYPMVWHMGTKVSDEHYATIFRVEDGGIMFL